MFELLTLVVFVWILIKCIGLMLRITWGVAKIVAAIILVLATVFFGTFLLRKK